MFNAYNYNTCNCIVYPNHQFIYSIGRNFCLEGSNTIPDEVFINCTLKGMALPPPQFSMNMTRIFKNNTVQRVLSEQAANLFLNSSRLDSLFEENIIVLRITCNVSNSFGNDNKTTDITICGM